jgi:hypothetical protein
MDELGTVRDLLDEVGRWRARAASSGSYMLIPFVALRSSGTRVILVHGRGGVVQRWLGMCVLLSWYPARGLQLLRIGQKYLLNQRLISDRFAGRQIPVAAVGLLREPAVDAAEAAIVVCASCIANARCGLIALTKSIASAIFTHDPWAGTRSVSIGCSGTCSESPGW